MEQTDNITSLPADLEQQLAEAEERGYRRGLNEQIESKMREPAMWEGPDGGSPSPPGEFQILESLRGSIWDEN